MLLNIQLSWVSMEKETESSWTKRTYWLVLEVAPVFVSPCQLKAKPAISQWLKFHFYLICIVRIHHAITDIHDALICQVVTSLLICSKWLFSNVLIMQMRWVTINQYFSDFLMPVPHLNVWTVFSASLSWALYHFYQVLCIVFIFPLILHPAPIQELLLCFYLVYSWQQ